MTPAPLRAAVLLVLASTVTPAFAQSVEPGPSLETCAAIETDAMRLACYDGLARRSSAGPLEADLAAARARAEQQAAEREDAGPAAPQMPARADDLFRHDEALGRALANAGRGSLLDSRWELARDSKLGVFNFRVYKPVYLMPAFWTSNVNERPTSLNPDNTVTDPIALDAVETKFQLSFKTKAVENLFGDNGDIWMGYTQSSRWQVYNSEESRPFRETNYEPEVLLVFRNAYSLGGWKGRMAAVGINHQSNGRGDPLSRSWNRIMFNIGLDRENWALMLRPWIRVSDGSDDDNPQMEDYIGRGDATLTHVRGRNEFSLMARHSLRGGDRSRGAVQFDWGFPVHPSIPMRGRLQLFHGYGESLIDYNHKATYVGLGVSLQEWFEPHID
ncbi:phospholipase A [Luteimonas kalidii]|uniref:Phospholipase A1 n=1 Tax=Luteimonas kalidii TaxID=3042025 RepID=A0ABT6JT69_9GAMM|nr:phospholipase A [Luteimonas kalidii]MDH5833885.1 phospholipase A [Luteimonas kalidii]